MTRGQQIEGRLAGDSHIPISHIHKPHALTPIPAPTPHTHTHNQISRKGVRVMWEMGRS